MDRQRFSPPDPPILMEGRGKKDMASSQIGIHAMKKNEAEYRVVGVEEGGNSYRAVMEDISEEVTSEQRPA